MYFPSAIIFPTKAAQFSTPRVHHHQDFFQTVCVSAGCSTNFLRGKPCLSDRIRADVIVILDCHHEGTRHEELNVLQTALIEHGPTGWSGLFPFSCVTLHLTDASPSCRCDVGTCSSIYLSDLRSGSLGASVGRVPKITSACTTKSLNSLIP